MKPRTRRKKAAALSSGLAAPETASGNLDSLDELAEAVEQDGGKVLGRYRDPVGGKPLLLTALPVDRVEPTPYQRDPSDTHVKRLMGVFEKIGLFLDPIIVIRRDEGYWTPNGNHRLQALKKLGFRAVTALLVPDADVAFKILALNTEKAHNLREKSLETIRMARALAGMSDAAEASYAFEFEQPSFLTLGVGYEQRPRLSGGAYQSILKKTDEFLDMAVAKALKERERRGQRVLTEEERAYQPVPEIVRRVPHQLHALLEGAVDRLRRSLRQDHGERAEVQCRSREAGRRGEERGRAGRRRMRIADRLPALRVFGRCDRQTDARHRAAPGQPVDALSRASA
jgi:ParB family chromosome partitioning protein